METNDFDILNFFRGLKVETKEEITRKYLKGIIDKDEFIRRMKNAK